MTKIIRVIFDDYDDPLIAQVLANDDEVDGVVAELTAAAENTFRIEVSDPDPLESAIEAMKDINGKTNYPRFVNLYEVWRMYGGPEEGGWYYDQYEPLISVKVESEQEETETRAKLWKKFGPSYRYDEKGEAGPRRRDRYSVLGGADLEIQVDDVEGRRNPERKPHYE